MTETGTRPSPASSRLAGLVAALAVLTAPMPAARATLNLSLAPSPALPPPASAGFRVEPGSVRKICQLVGDVDRETGRPTLNATETAYGFWGTDLGVSVEHRGRLHILFGDTHPRPGLDRPRDADLIATTADRNPDDCLDLDVPRAADGGYRPLTIPGVRLGQFEVPTGGFSLAGRLYLIATTDNSPAATMGRSVLAVSEDEGASFRKLYDLSTHRFINVAAALAEPTGSTGASAAADGAVLLFGTGSYRRSDPYLAVLPALRATDRTAIRYFAGAGPDGTEPRWSEREADAVPLFPAGCMGELSVGWAAPLARWLILYNCAETGGGRARILLRTAERPWGPWSAPLTLFDPANDGDCRFIQAAYIPDRAPDCGRPGDPHTPEVAGDAYGPYLIQPFTRGEPGGGATVYFTLSTWNPYTVVLMRATLAADGAWTQAAPAAPIVPVGLHQAAR